jgi:hypothetical protein
MKLFEDIEYKEDVVYQKSSRTLIEKYDSTDCEIIEEPVISMNSLHFCYSHAIIDSCFPIFFLIQDLIAHSSIPNNNVRIFITEDFFNWWPDLYLPLVADGKYVKSWKNIIEILSPHPVIFEHLLDTSKKFLFRKYFKYPMDDGWQRSIWNCANHYTIARPVPQDRIKYTDEILYERLMQFRNHVFAQYNIQTPVHTKKNVAVIDRKHTRRFDKEKLDRLVTVLQSKENCEFRGVFILEDMTFEETLRLYATNQVIASIHGSSGINMLFAPFYSIFIEFDLETERKQMYSRVCKLTKSRHIYLNCFSFDIDSIRI